jgi:hypothetical protein
MTMSRMMSEQLYKATLLTVVRMSRMMSEQLYK